MLQLLAPFLPPVVLFGAVYFHEQCSSSVRRRLFSWAVVTAFSLFAIGIPSPFNHLAKYMIGFFSSWYVIWSANLLLVKDLTTLECIQKQPHSSPAVYVWQPLPSSHCSRFFWAVDLTFNFRAIGWNFSTLQLYHPLIAQSHQQIDIDSRRKKPSRVQDLAYSQPAFLRHQVLRLLVSWTWFFAYRFLIRGAVTHTPGVTQLIRDDAHELGPGSLIDSLSVATTMYMFMNGIHAAVSLVAVFALDEEIWRYPPFFGQKEYVFTGRLQDLWGEFWHGLLKEGLLATSRGIFPWKKPKKFWGIIRIWACFVLTGAVHSSASYVGSRDLLPSLCAGAFFCLQPVGILLQSSVTSALRSVLPKVAVAAGLLTCLEIALGLMWFRCTIPWVSGDPALRQAIGYVLPAF